MTNEEDNVLRDNLIKRLELELGLPLTPKAAKKIDKDFDDSVILLENFPVQEVVSIKIDNKKLCGHDFIVNESEGIVYLNSNHSGFLYVKYLYGLKEDEYNPLIDLMVEYEMDNSWDKDASSIKENNVTVNYDTSLGKGALIQSMIQDLRNKYSCVVEMI